VKSKLYFSIRFSLDLSYLKGSEVFVKSARLVVRERNMLQLPHRITQLLRDSDHIAQLLGGVTENDTVGFYSMFKAITSENSSGSMFEYPEEEVSECIHSITNIINKQIYQVEKDSHLDESLEEAKYRLLEGNNKTIKENKLLHGYKLTFIYQYTKKLRVIEQILKEIDIAQNKCKRLKIQDDNENPITIKNGTEKTVLVICSNEKQRIEIENFLSLKDCNEFDNLDLLIRLKKYLNLRKDSFTRCMIIYEYSIE